MNNEGLMHRELAIQRHQKWQKENPDAYIQRGDFVKIAMREDGTPDEHVWVLVSTVTGKIVSGKLANDPVYLKKVRDGSEVILQYSQIEDHIVS